MIASKGETVATTGRPTDLGAYLIQETAARGWTLAEFARRTDLTMIAVNRLIYADAAFTPARCWAVANALNVPFETVALLANLIDSDWIEPPTS
jgi:transcriptional regulator with XRE-family HTH domain